jgi:hypothetical protein
MRAFKPSTLDRRSPLRYTRCVTSRPLILLAVLSLAGACQKPDKPAAPVVAQNPVVLERFELQLKTSLGAQGVKTHPTSYTLSADRTLTWPQGHVKVSVRELAPLEAILQGPSFADATKPSRDEMGGVDGYALHVSSKTVNADATGYWYERTPAAITSILTELDKLRALTDAERRHDYDVKFVDTNQGGTAGYSNTLEVTSSGAATKTDPAGKLLQSGTASADDRAPLERILASPELAALGTAYKDPTAATGGIESDYTIDLGSGATFQGIAGDKTPPILSSLMFEMHELVQHATPPPHP